MHPLLSSVILSSSVFISFFLWFLFLSVYWRRCYFFLLPSAFSFSSVFTSFFLCFFFSSQCLRSKDLNLQCHACILSSIFCLLFRHSPPVRYYTQSSSLPFYHFIFSSAIHFLFVVICFPLLFNLPFFSYSCFIPLLHPLSIRICTLFTLSTSSLVPPLPFSFSLLYPFTRVCNYKLLPFSYILLFSTDLH